MDYFCGHSQLFQPQIARPYALIFAESAARVAAGFRIKH